MVKEKLLNWVEHYSDMLELADENHPISMFILVSPIAVLVFGVLLCLFTLMDYFGVWGWITLLVSAIVYVYYSVFTTYHRLAKENKDMVE